VGPGESAVLAWAHAHPGSEAICDDLAARRCAKTLGIPVRGTVGIILLAKQRGIIGAARPIMENMVRLGMYLSDRTLNDALALVGE
jgi:predicted nucleic acid-binding protein